jgi:hypothetical protein
MSVPRNDILERTQSRRRSVLVKIMKGPRRCKVLRRMGKVVLHSVFRYATCNRKL